MTTARVCLTAFLLMLGGCGCLVIGDGAFGVMGSLPANAKNCEIALLSETGAELPFSRMPVQQKFSETFVVAPCAETYRVILSCGGAIRKSVTVRYGSEVKPGQKVSLGEIAL